jgi:hypothetical protein
MKINLAFFSFGISLLATGFFVADVVADETVQSNEMNIYELYSWRYEGEWVFKVLPNKSSKYTNDEVFDAKNALHGVNGLEAKVAKMPVGTTFVWIGVSRDAVTQPKDGDGRKLELPPKDEQAVIIDWMRTKKMELIIEPK